MKVCTNQILVLSLPMRLKRICPPQLFFNNDIKLITNSSATNGSKKPLFINEADYNEECLIIGTGDKASIHYSKQLSTSTDNFTLRPKDNNFCIKYVFYN